MNVNIHFNEDELRVSLARCTSLMLSGRCLGQSNLTWEEEMSNIAVFIWS